MHARDEPGPPIIFGSEFKMCMCATAMLFLIASLAVLGAQAMPVVDPPQNYSKPANFTRPRAGTYGLDISSYVSVSDFECLKNNGYEFAIVRAYQSLGKPDPNAVANINNARQAGLSYVDAYMFPCPTCSLSASAQVKEMVDNLGSSNYGQIWLDIEGSQYWKGSYSSNQYFFQELLSAASRYKTTGVYASAYQWGVIMGSSYTGGSAHQLWYPHYDDSPSFSDFSPFGGWSRPAIKQYQGDAYVCGVDIDKDWY